MLSLNGAQMKANYYRAHICIHGLLKQQDNQVLLFKVIALDTR